MHPHSPSSQTKNETPGGRPGSLRFTRQLLLCGAALLTLASGCGGGGGGLAFTGGGIPNGGGSRVYGVALAADYPVAPLTNAFVKIVSNGQTQQIRTGADGAFEFPSVASGASVTLTVTPETSDRYTQTITFTVTPGQAIDALVALPKKTLDIATGTALSLTPSLARMPANDTVQLTARVRDKNGTVIPALPTLIYDGNSGSLTTDYQFHSTATGGGTFVAYWANTLAASSRLLVDNTAQQNPPPPPNSFPPPVAADTQR